MPRESSFEQGRKSSQEQREGLVIEQLRETAKAPSGPPKTDFERLQQMVGTMKTGARSEQMATEMELQSALTLASEKVADAQKMEQISALIENVTQKLSEGNESLKSDPATFLRMVEQLRMKIGEQQLMAESQVARATQQAVGALAESQAALFQSKTLASLSARVKELEDTARVGWGASGPGGWSGAGSPGGSSKEGSDKNSKQLPLQ